MNRPEIDEQDVINTLGQTRTRTLFTTGQPFGTTHKILAVQKWTKIKLRLETAGPVTVGTSPELGAAIGGGQGASLGADELDIVLKKGDVLYYVANAVNRVRMISEPLPWAEQMILRVSSILGLLSDAAGVKAPAVGAPPVKTKKPNFGHIRGKRW